MARACAAARKQLARRFSVCRPRFPVCRPRFPVCSDHASLPRPSDRQHLLRLGMVSGQRAARATRRPRPTGPYEHTLVSYRRSYRLSSRIDYRNSFIFQPPLSGGVYRT